MLLLTDQHITEAEEQLETLQSSESPSSVSKSHLWALVVPQEVLVLPHPGLYALPFLLSEYIHMAEQDAVLCSVEGEECLSHPRRRLAVSELKPVLDDEDEVVEAPRGVLLCDRAVYLLAVSIKVVVEEETALGMTEKAHKPRDVL